MIVHLFVLSFVALFGTLNADHSENGLVKDGRPVMNKTILLTGGAGYIGSHTAYHLHTMGFKVVIVDSFLHSQQFSQPWATVITGDLSDSGIEKVFKEHAIDAVMHFAAFIEVGESVKRPADFYHNNVVNTLKLLDTMRKYGVKKIIFSSTCAIYGTPQYVPIDELHPFSPQSPYGKTKLCVEYILQDYAQAYGLNYVALRYFNAAGAFQEQGLGEYHEPETHVIPLLLRALKDNQPFTMLGDDYPTPDGTCIRDYVHVRDIAQAHALALDYLTGGGCSDVFNLGSGKGYSVKELIDVAQQVTGKKLQVVLKPRRPGDVSVLVAKADKAQKILHWEPQYSSINEIISSAWGFENRPTKKDEKGVPLTQF